jgi:hypothetical protein
MVDQAQMDRIERKLDEVLAFRDLVLKLALPRVPAALRTKVAQVMGGREAS